jgi:hypothetical protein
MTLTNRVRFLPAGLLIPVSALVLAVFVPTSALALATPPDGSPPINIPFDPSQTVGFGLIALFIGLWQVPRTRALMKRSLVPAKV